MRYIFNLIAIAMLVLLVFGAIKFKESDAYLALRWNMGNFFQRAKNFVETRKQNIGEEIKPARKSPLTFIQIQSELENWMPEVFVKFSEADWQKMWELIYKPDKVKKGLFFYTYRYKTRAEVEAALRYQHRDLSILKSNDWWELWNIAKVSWSDERE